MADEVQDIRLSPYTMEGQGMKLPKAAAVQPEGDTIFGKIIRGDVPATFIYEDDKCVALKDANPQAPTHFLVIPRKPLVSLMKSTDGDKELLGHLLCVARKTAESLGLDNGYRIVINNGPDGAQTVNHLHLHVMGGRQMGWPLG